MTWILILGLAWGNPDSRISGPMGDVIKIERIEVATEADCKRAANDWVYTNRHNSPVPSGALVFATCAGQKP